MNDLSEIDEDRIVELVTKKHCLESAIAMMLGQFDAASNELVPGGHRRS